MKTCIKNVIFASGAILMTAGLLDLFNLCPASTFFTSWIIGVKFVVITFTAYSIGWMDAKLYDK
jgi:uncharacterized membrane protein HdeD (DUF308 family)